MNFMRLSLMKGAHAVLSGVACRKFGASRSFFARCGIPPLLTQTSTQEPTRREPDGSHALVVKAEILHLPPRPGAPHPRFPVRLKGFDELHAPFLNERRTRGFVRCSVQEIRGISLVFREMWDTTALNPKTPDLKTNPKETGPVRSPKRTWAEKDGAKPLHSFLLRRILNLL